MHSQTAWHPATSCSCGGGILLQLRFDWVVNIAHSRKHHTRAEHAVLLCIRGLSFTGKPCPGESVSRFATSEARRGCCTVADWSRAFDDPIPLPRGRHLVTLNHLLDEWRAVRSPAPA